MRHIRWIHVAALLLFVIIVPVLVEQILPQQSRRFEGVSLDETRHIEISFHNAAQQLDLGGLLFVPAGDGPFPAAIVIHGSGTSIRDNRWYLTLTRYLQDNGIVVLLPDKRGSEQSEGDWRTSSFHDLATDTLAAIDYLKYQDQVAIARIGVVGMSQGGWIAPIVASQSDELAFAVSVVGAMVSPVEQLSYEENHNLRQMGFLPGVSNFIALLSTRWIRNVAQREFWDAVGDYDPIDYWRDLEVEALALFGSEDTNVPSLESAARLQALGNPLIRTVTYAGSGHPLEDPPGQGNSIFREDALADIRDFIRRRPAK